MGLLTRLDDRYSKTSVDLLLLKIVRKIVIIIIIIIIIVIVINVCKYVIEY